MSKHGDAGPAVRGSSREAFTHRTTLECTACESTWTLERTEASSTLEFESRIAVSRRAHIQSCEAAGLRVIDGEDQRKVIPSSTEVIN